VTVCPIILDIFSQLDNLHVVFDDLMLILVHCVHTFTHLGLHSIQ